MKFIEQEVMMLRKIFLQLRSDILSEIYDDNLLDQMTFKKTVEYYSSLKRIWRYRGYDEKHTRFDWPHELGE